MSKQVGVSIICPECKNQFKVSLFRTMWIENPKNRDLVLTDKVNFITCPSCKATGRVKFPFLCTNVNKGFAIWYEPFHDPVIDKDVAQYAAHFGENSFYALAPRIKDWNEFKKRLIEMEESASRNPPVRPFISPEMNADVSGFVRTLRHSSNKLPTENQFYPSWLRHLQSTKKRMFYAMLPCIALLIFVDLNGEAPHAPSVTAPTPAPPVTGPKASYDLDAAFDRIVGPRDPNAATPAPPVPDPPASAVHNGVDYSAIIEQVAGPVPVNPAKIQRALEDAAGTEPDYLALLNEVRADAAADKVFSQSIGQIVLRFLVMTALAFALLTLVHAAASMYKPWSLLSKPFRMYWFFSACWVFAVTLFVMVFDPYKIGGLSEMGTDQYSHMFSIAFVIPIFIGLFFYVYQRYVK